jgi:hypothetical protein
VQFLSKIARSLPLLAETPFIGITRFFPEKGESAAMILSGGFVKDKEIQKAWRCPKCGRIFRQHVIAGCTYASGPVCNKCTVDLEWADSDAGAIGPRLLQNAM